jgi:hypothetical protein
MLIELVIGPQRQQHDIVYDQGAIPYKQTIHESKQTEVKNIVYDYQIV